MGRDLGKGEAAEELQIDELRESGIKGGQLVEGIAEPDPRDRVSAAALSIAQRR